MAENTWTVPEAGPIEVLFKYADDKGADVTRGFRISPKVVRALNQFCVDNGRVIDNVPDTLGLFIETAYGTVKPNGDEVPGLVMSILARYKDYPDMLSEEETLAKADESAAQAKLVAAKLAAMATDLQLVEEVEGLQK